MGLLYLLYAHFYVNYIFFQMQVFYYFHIVTVNCWAEIVTQA